MADDGVLMMCMSAGGTAEDFLEAYETVIKRQGEYSLENEKGYHNIGLPGRRITENQDFRKENLITVMGLII